MSPYHFETGSLLSCRLLVLARLAGQWVLKICLFLHTNAGATGTGSHAWLLILLLVIRTQVLVCTEKELLPIEPTPQPLHNHLSKCDLLWASVQLHYGQHWLAHFVYSHPCDL